MTARTKRTRIKVRGIVMPSAWDSRNRVSRVSIFAIGEQEYPVLPKDKGAELFGLVRQAVAAVGLLVERPPSSGLPGGKWFQVESYEILGDAVDWDRDST